MKQEGEEINYKHWLSRTIFVGIILTMLVLVIDRYFDVDLLEDTILTIMITLLLGFFHEYLHYRKAIALGYKPVWWRTKFRMGFSIDTDIKTEERTQEDKKLSIKEQKKKNIKDTHIIGVAPYKILVPFSILALILGTYLWFEYQSFGLLIASIASLIMHTYTYNKEGKEV